METSCVKQSDKSKYVAHVLEEVVSEKYRHRETFVAYAALYATRRYTFATTSSSTLLVFSIAPDSFMHLTTSASPTSFLRGIVDGGDIEGIIFSRTGCWMGNNLAPRVKTYLTPINSVC